MSNSLRFTLRTLYFPIKNDFYKVQPSNWYQSVRFLYAKGTLGIDAFVEHKKQVKTQMENIEAKFREKMATYTTGDSGSMIFTEDLKNMLHLTENDDDINLVIRMAKKFNGQNKQLRFGNFVFGPVVMRMFHVHNKPDLALECFKMPELDGFFDQLISFQILLDLLYENGKYQEILDTFEIIKNKQLQDAKYPRNAVVLVMAACYKLNSQESAKYALGLWNELIASGHFPMRRATTFCAGLALNQGKPEAALEIICTVKNQNYMTIRNIKVRALAEIGRLDDAIVILKSILSEDQPKGVTQTFNRDVLDFVKEAVVKSGNPEISLEFSKLEQLFEKEGHIEEETLDSQLSSEIQQPPILNNRQANKFSRYNPDQPRRTDQSRRSFPRDRFSQRPGLNELV